MNLLSRFAIWQDRSVDVLNQLLEIREEQGWWDFGKRSGKCMEFPLSQN